MDDYNESRDICNRCHKNSGRESLLACGACRYCTFQTVSSSRVTADPLDELPACHVTHPIGRTNLFRVTSPFGNTIICQLSSSTGLKTALTLILSLRKPWARPSKASWPRKLPRHCEFKREPRPYRFVVTHHPPLRTYHQRTYRYVTHHA